MRRSWPGPALAAVCLMTACGQPTAAPPPSPSPSTLANAQVNPANIGRVRGILPAGYELADMGGPASPVAYWGFGPGWVIEPSQCTMFASPPTDEATTRAWSASGPGGIVHAVVTGSPAAPVAFDPAVLAECGQWTAASGNTTGTVHLIDAPAIDGATTVGMATEATTVVEGGTATSTTASTFCAYLGDYLAFVTVVDDPGSPNPPLGVEFASDLLVETVSALRG
ncbi:DUF5642 family protein [Mycolicibacterium agri]|nr:DUF5642 family protein [Mycolicibacterium agri]